MTKKLVTLANRAGQPIGEADLYDAHRHPAQLHLASSVWLIREVGDKRQVLLQKRSEKKIVGANQWGNGICGNVRPAEDPMTCAKRRLREEIGIENVFLVPAYEFEYQVFSNDEYGEHEYDHVFIGEYEGRFDLNPDEVQEVVWIDFEDLERQVFAEKIIAAEETLDKPTNELKDLTKPLTLVFDEQNIELSPWTAIMLGDERLWQALRNFD